MVEFRVVARVGGERLQHQRRIDRLQQWDQAVHIRRGAAAGQGPQDQVSARVQDQFEFGIALVKRRLGGRFVLLLSLGAAFDVVAAGVTAG